MADREMGYAACTQVSNCTKPGAPGKGGDGGDGGAFGFGWGGFIYIPVYGYYWDDGWHQYLMGYVEMMLPGGGGQSGGGCTNYVMANCGAANNLTMHNVQWQSNCLNQVSSNHTQAMNNAQNSFNQAAPSADWAGVFSFAQMIRYATMAATPGAREVAGGIATAALIGSAAKGLYFTGKAAVQSFVAEVNFVSGYATCASTGIVH
jgi:hypothetical protein